MTSALQPKQFGVICLLLMVVIVVAGFITLAASTQVIDLLSSHGVTKHGYSALQIRECLNRHGPLQIWVNPSTGRRANLCQLDPETFGIQIIEDAGEKWREVTAFTKDKMSKIEQVMQYLRNSGYVPLK